MNRVSACVRLHAYLCTRTLQVAVSVRASLPPSLLSVFLNVEMKPSALLSGDTELPRLSSIFCSCCNGKIALSFRSSWDWQR